MDTSTPTELNPKMAESLKWAVGAFLDGRQDHYSIYGRYIRGDHPLEFATPKFESAFGRLFREFAANVCPAIVDAHADRLQIKAFESTNTAAAKKAQEIWQANEMDVREGQVEHEQFGYGVGYLVIEADIKTGEPVMWPQRASSMRVQRSKERPGEITRAVKQWIDDEGRARLTLYYPDRIEKFAAKKGTLLNRTAAAKFLPFKPQGDATWPIRPVVTDTVPVFPFHNNAGIGDYGTSELQSVIPLQDALNKDILDMLVAQEFAAAPQRYAIGMEDPEDSGALKRWVSGASTMFMFEPTGEGTASVGTFPAVNIEQFTRSIDKATELISTVSRVPMRYLQSGSGREAISGESKRMDESPFVARIEDRQRAAGAEWGRAIRYALRTARVEVAPGEVKPTWIPAAPLSEAEMRQKGLELQRLGYPLEIILERMGEGADTITKILELKQKQADEDAARGDLAFRRGNITPLTGSR